MDIQQPKDFLPLFIAGFEQRNILSHHAIVKLIRNGLSGVILYDKGMGHYQTHARNIENLKQLTNLCYDLKEIADNNLLISIEAEGGKLFPLTQTSKGVKKNNSKTGFSFNLPAASTQSNQNRSSYIIHQELSKYLKNIGFNLNFGLVANVKGKSDFIEAARCFSDKPEDVSDKVILSQKGFQTSKFSNVIKYFLGDNAPIDTQLSIFRKIIESSFVEVDAIQVSNTANLQIDDGPVACSKIAITDTLRNCLDFKGLIIAEDFETSQACSVDCLDNQEYQQELSKYLVKSINAGVNMFVISNRKFNNIDSIMKSCEYLYDEYYSNNIDKNALAESFKHIEVFKRKSLAL